MDERRLVGCLTLITMTEHSNHSGDGYCSLRFNPPNLCEEHLFTLLNMFRVHNDGESYGRSCD